MRIYVTNREFLIPKLKRFYEGRYEKLKQEKKEVRKADIMKHFREMARFISNSTVDKELTQPTFNEWIDKEYKQFKHKNWFFAVKYIPTDDEREELWVTVDCHHESKNHNGGMVNEWRNFPEIQAILDLEQRMDTYKSQSLVGLGYFIALQVGVTYGMLNCYPDCLV